MRTLLSGEGGDAVLSWFAPIPYVAADNALRLRPHRVLRLETEYAAGQRARDRHAFQIGAVQSLNMVLTTVASVLILLVGAGRVQSGALTPGQLMFVFTMAGMLLGPLEQLAALVFVFGETQLSLRKCAEILDLPSERRAGGVLLRAVSTRDRSARPRLGAKLR